MSRRDFKSFGVEKPIRIPRWEPLQRGHLTDPLPPGVPEPNAVFLNTEYMVQVNLGHHPEVGDFAHISIRRQDRAAIHDWRDLQRIKNELLGPEAEAIELYPAESRLTDSANQYHLWGFRTWKVPIGYQERLVGDGEWNKSKQRPWPEHDRPQDAIDADEYNRRFAEGLSTRALVDALHTGHGRVSLEVMASVDVIRKAAGLLPWFADMAGPTPGCDCDQAWNPDRGCHADDCTWAMEEP